jgi:hypothetical protein
MPQLWNSPALRSDQLSKIGGAGDGLKRVFDVPSPTWPSRLFPQPHNVQPVADSDSMIIAATAGALLRNRVNIARSRHSPAFAVRRR